MGIYITYSCPKCRQGLEYLVPAGARGVGEPFRQCPKCDGVIDVGELYNEWDLMSDSEKSNMRARVHWTAAQYGGTVGFLLSVWILGYLFEKQIGDDWVTPILTIGLVGSVIGYLIYRPIVASQLNKQITESTARMQQPEDRQKLSSLGPLPPQ